MRLTKRPVIAFKQIKDVGEHMVGQVDARVALLDRVL